MWHSRTEEVLFFSDVTIIAADLKALLFLAHLFSYPLARL